MKYQDLKISWNFGIFLNKSHRTCTVFAWRFLEKMKILMRLMKTVLVVMSQIQVKVLLIFMRNQVMYCQVKIVIIDWVRGHS